MRACRSLGEAAATSHCPQSYPARNCSYRDLPWCQRSINHRPNGFRANSFLVVAAIVDVGAALIVPFEVINEFGDEDVGPTYLCLRGGEPLHKRD